MTIASGGCDGVKCCFNTCVVGMAQSDLLALDMSYPLILHQTLHRCGGQTCDCIRGAHLDQTDQHLLLCLHKYQLQPSGVQKLWEYTGAQPRRDQGRNIARWAFQQQSCKTNVCLAGGHSSCTVRCGMHFSGITCVCDCGPQSHVALDVCYQKVKHHYFNHCGGQPCHSIRAAHLRQVGQGLLLCIHGLTMQPCVLRTW